MTKIHIFFLVCVLNGIALGTVYSSDRDPKKASLKTESNENTQQFRVTGKVTDASTGEPMLGVTVVVKGTTIGQITDPMGNFSINIPQREVVLVFSSIGYASQEVMVSDGAVINVAMTVDVLEMEEVVVVGYGIQKKETVVGAITQTTGDEILSNLRGADLTNALTGNLPGLITVQNTGIPGGSGFENPATQIFIRGRKTWNNSQPLILVDGIEREMNDVDPYTVEGISVLKDASATAVFGVKGANGVILITTKRGQLGRPKLTLNISTTAKAVSRLDTPLGSYDALKLKNYALLNEVSAYEASWAHMIPEQILNYYRDQTYPDYLPDVNWSKEFLKDFATDKNINLSISGGTKIVKYFGSLSYLNEGDVINIKDVGQGYDPSFGYNRLNYRSNLDFSITPTTNFSANLSGFFGSQKRPRQGLSNEEWYTLYRNPPDMYPYRYSDGIWANWDEDARFQNRILTALFSGYTLAKVSEVNTDFALNQKLDFITKGLAFKGKLSYDIRANTTGPNLLDDGVMAKYIRKDIMDEIKPGLTESEIKAIENKYTVYLLPTNWNGSHGFDFMVEPYTFGNESAETNVYRQLNYELSLNYNREFGKHNIGGLFLMSRNERATGSVFPSYREDWVGRAVYSYDSRYLLEFNGAYNGSEKFARENRFGFFPSFAAGWNISNEQFFSGLTNVINNLKLRFSNGKVGSDAGIDRWLYTGSYDITNTTWAFGAPFIQRSPYTQPLEGVIPNPDIKWETSEKTDLGIEAAFFNNMVSLNFDYFWEDRTNIFIVGDERIVPEYFGAPAVAGNLGQVKNEGWEIEADFSKTTPGGLKYFAGISWAFSKDLIIKKSDPELAPFYQKQAGYSIGQPRRLLNEEIIDNWNDVYTGVLTQANTYILPGDFRMIDFNSDGIISPDDAAPVGYPARPQYSIAPRIGMDYKGFSLHLNFYGTYNTDGEQSGGGIYGPFQFEKSLVWKMHQTEAWSPEFGITGDDAKYHGVRFSTGSSGGPVFTSRAAFRLKTAMISYNLKSSVLKEIGVSNMRFFINGENLFLWSDMLRDADSDANLSRGYPILKRITFGINLNF